MDYRLVVDSDLIVTHIANNSGRLSWLISNVFARGGPDGRKISGQEEWQESSAYKGHRYSGGSDGNSLIIIIRQWGEAEEPVVVSIKALSNLVSVIINNMLEFARELYIFV